MADSNYRSGSDWRDRDDDDSRRARESMERDQYGRTEAGGRGGYGQTYNRGYGNRGYGQGDYDQRYGQDESDRGGRYSQSGRSSESGYGRGREYLSGEGRHHYGNESGGWGGREEEQWRNRDVHGHYDREANYGGFSSSGTGNYRGYGGSGGSSEGGQGRWGQAGMQYSQSGYGWPERGRSDERMRYGRGPGSQSHSQDFERSGRSYGGSDYRPGQGGYGQGGFGGSSGRPSGGRAYGDYSGSPSGYFGDDYGRPGSQQRSQWGSQGQQGQEQDYGQHRGRGPRGYKRSDDRIREDVCDCLTDDDNVDATYVEIMVKDGEVTLTGFVTDREDKRWAETLAERISGVKHVQNNLRVQDQQQRTQSSVSASTSGQQGSGAGGTTGTSGGAAAAGRDKGKESNIQH